MGENFNENVAEQKGMKKCCKCGMEKGLDEFNNCSFTKDGKQFKCRLCEKEYKIKNKERYKINHQNYYLKNKEKQRYLCKKWYMENKEKAREKIKKWHQENREKEKQQKAEYYLKNKEHIKNRINKYRKNNKEKYKEYQREYANKRRSEDSSYEIAHRLRIRIRNALKNNQKFGHTLELLGCTIDEFKIYLEKQFSENMTW